MLHFSCHCRGGGGVLQSTHLHPTCMTDQVLQVQITFPTPLHDDHTRWLLLFKKHYFIYLKGSHTQREYLPMCSLLKCLKQLILGSPKTGVGNNSRDVLYGWLRSMEFSHLPLPLQECFSRSLEIERQAGTSIQTL